MVRKVARNRQQKAFQMTMTMLIQISPVAKILMPVIYKIIRTSHVSNGDCISVLNVIQNEGKGFAQIVMQKPPVNSLSLELAENLTEAIKELEKKNYRGMILTSNSPTVFSAGLDITEVVNPNEERLVKVWKAFQNMWKTLYLTPLVTIAAVNGHAPGIGCLLALSCDHSIMVKSKALIGLNETMVGIVAPKWMCDLYVNNVGFKRAEHSLKISKMYTPEEALELGIVNDLVDSKSELMSKAEQEMEKWLKVPAMALQTTKLSMRKHHVEKLIFYEKQETEEFVKFFCLEETQKNLGKYFESLKAKKK